MAPAVTAHLSQAPQIAHKLPKKSNSDAPKNVFPDGIRTSGQLAPIYELLRPYSEFPKEVSGPTVWKAEDYRDHPERWTHPFSEEEIEELSQAADKFIASDTPLTGITKVKPFCNFIIL
jgi:hypothetical protein